MRLDRMDRTMPKPALVLCRGWRGVSAFARRTLEKLTESDPLALSRTLVLVPTAAAAHLYRNQLERDLSTNRDVVFLPVITTPGPLFQDLAERSQARVRLADPLLREALLDEGFQKAAASGSPPPFKVRAGLAPRVLQFYDELLQNRAELKDFTKRALEELEASDDPDDDLGAAKMAAQTRFLEASLEAYREALERLELHDPPSVRRALSKEPFPYERALVLGSETLTPADLDFLTQARGLESLSVVVVDEVSALPASLAEAAPDLHVDDTARATPPKLLNPAVHVARDREESLVDAVRFMKKLEDKKDLPLLDRIAIVVPRPLPYLYLAKKVLGEAGIPFELQDSFPLATEPYMAAVDLAIELVATDARRDETLALLRSPFFIFKDVGPAEVAALDALTLRYQEPGGQARWQRLFQKKSRPPAQPSLPGMESGDAPRRVLPPLAAILETGKALVELRTECPLGAKIRCLRDFLETHTRTLPDERHQRARAAVDMILERLEEAALHVGDPPIDFRTFREKFRRAVEAHTFAFRTGSGGVTVVDARSAGFGAFDLVILLGINEGEWPARGERNIFFPQWLLRDFGWPSDRKLLARERTRFRELLDLGRDYLVLIRHQLEDEIPTVASPFLEEVETWIEESPHETEPSINDTITEDDDDDDDDVRELVVTKSEALRRGLLQPSSPLPIERRPGMVGAPLAVPDPVSPTALELYLRCPFKYFSRYLLGLEEEEKVEAMLTPLERGRILHDLLHEGFKEWDAGQSDPRPIEPESYEDALALFRAIAVRKIPPEHRSVELRRLFGGPGEAGALEWLLRREMARGPLRQRLLEHPFQTPLRLTEGPGGEKPWFVQIKGRVDRADVDADGRLHVYDYKSGRAPEASVTLQVPLYSMCLSQDLGAPIEESVYLSFRDRRSTARADYQKASAFLVETFDGIQNGRFPPKPHRDTLCYFCGFVGVCRKEIQEDA